MRKRVFGRQLSRERDTRRALFRSLVWALVEHGKISTTKTKAKSIQGLVDKLVVLSKKGTTVANRRVFAILGNNKKATKELFDNIAPALSKRNSGFTRIVNLGKRRGDGAEVVRLEWVEEILPAASLKSSEPEKKQQKLSIKRPSKSKAKKVSSKSTKSKK